MFIPGNLIKISSLNLHNLLSGLIMKTKIKNLWSVVVVDQDNEAEVFHISAKRKPSLKKAIMLSYGFDEDDEALKMISEELSVEIKPVEVISEPWVDSTGSWHSGREISL
jgi:uncharacterized protein YgfB (UPF0149 family)